MNNNIWQDMSDKIKYDFYKEYSNIKQTIRKVTSKKANTEKVRKYTELEQEEYNNIIATLQSKYADLNLKYRCPHCGIVFNLDLTHIKYLLKDNNKLLFCSRQCSGKYYANKQHKEETDEQKFSKNMKISNTLKSRELTLSDAQKQIRNDKLNSYWEKLTEKERSIRNSNNALTSLNNLKSNSNIWISKCECMLYDALINEYSLDVKHQCNFNGMLFDYMIKYQDKITLVEINGVYWHNKRPFNNSKAHIEEYNVLANSNVRNKRIADKWRYSDVMKLNYCKENNLNYIVLYNDRQIEKDSQKISKIIYENLNKGVIILLSEDLDMWV